jgi:Subtilase family
MAQHGSSGPGGRREQLARWISALEDPKIARQEVERVTDRHREDRREPRRGMPRVSVVALPSEGDLTQADLLLAGVELIVWRADLEEARPLLSDWTQAPLPDGCPLPVARFVGSTATRLRAKVAELRDHGIEASANHILPLAIRMKGGGSPDAAPDLVPRPHVAPDPAAAHVVVIDTGIWEDAAHRTDGWLAGVAASGDNVDPLNVINEEQGDPPGATTVGDFYLDDAAGHGTFAAGVVRQHAPFARVTVLRALDSDGIGSELGVACAIWRAGELRADVIGLSLGQESLGNRPPVALAAALESLDPAVVVVAAAGNSGDEIPVWPAAFKRVVAVSGLDASGNPSSWAKRGSWVDASTYAEDVVSTFVTGRENPQRGNPPDDWTGDSPTARWIGTSFAAPRVAGLVAAGMGTSVSAHESLRRLLASGRHLPGYGVALT